MLHDKFATERSLRNIGDIPARMEAAIEAKFVRNVDFTNYRDRLNSAYYDEKSAIPNRLGRPAHEESMWKDWYSVSDLVPFQLTHIRTIAKRLPGVLKKLTHQDPRIDAIVAEVQEFSARWTPILDNIEALKPFIVKGRVIGERIGEERTIENTGTCSCCMRNVKLKELKIVDHGFQVHGGRVGQCYGVNYHPIEVSTAGLVHLQELYTASKLAKETYLGRLERDEVDRFHVSAGYMKTEVIERTDNRFERSRKSEIGQTKYEISTLVSELTRIAKQIVDWQPALLPDGASHFAMKPAADEPSSDDQPSP